MDETTKGGGMDEMCMEHSAHARAIEKHDERLDAHGRQLDTLAETLAALKEIERQNQERIDAMDRRIAELEAQPAKRWEKAVTVAITGVVGAVVGMALAAAGMG